MKQDVRIRSGEWNAVGFATGWFFFILFSYMVVRPVRESLGVGIGKSGLTMVMWLTLAAMMIAVPVYAWLVTKLPRRWLVRVVFHFFAACAIGFFFLLQWDDPRYKTYLVYAFFIWVNVIALFITSVFWSVLADLFDSEQGKRLFGIIAGGGTAGAICGSTLTFQISKHLETYWLLLIPAVLIEAGLFCAWRLEKQAPVRGQPARTIQSNREKDSAGIWTGVVEVFRSPFLAMICVFLFFGQAFGTQLYFQQAEIVRLTIESEQQRTSFFASVDLGTQCLTLLIQLFIASFIMRRMGLRFAMVALPAVYLIGFAGLATSPNLTVVVVFMIAARSVGYGLTVPAREVLFTVVTRDQKYKSKNFIDTVLLRGADATSGAAYKNLSGIGITNSTLNLVALPMVLVWCGTALWLGRRQQKLATNERSSFDVGTFR